MQTHTEVAGLTQSLNDLSHCVKFFAEELETVKGTAGASARTEVASTLTGELRESRYRDLWQR